MGFFGAGLLDGYHALVTSEFFSAYLPSGLPSLIPWSWIASRVFMSFSGQLFDGMFDLAHVLKKLTYILVLIGLMISMFSLFRRAEKSASELAAAKDLAVSATQAKNQFLASMSHEIRTPMTAILGYADVLIERGIEENASSQQLEMVRTIKRNGENLVTIINDILDLSKIEAGKMAVEKTHCSPWQIAQDVVALQLGPAEAKALTLPSNARGRSPKTF